MQVLSCGAEHSSLCRASCKRDSGTLSKVPSFPLLYFPFLSFPFLSSSFLSSPSFLSYPILTLPFLSFPLLSFPVLSSPSISSPLLSILFLSFHLISFLFLPWNDERWFPSMMSLIKFLIVVDHLMRATSIASWVIIFLLPLSFLLSDLIHFCIKFLLNKNLSDSMKHVTCLLFMLYRFQVSEIHAGHLWDSCYFCGCQATCSLSLTLSKNHDWLPQLYNNPQNLWILNLHECELFLISSTSCVLCRHAVIGPASLFLCQCLTQCPVRTSKDVASGLLVCSILMSFNEETHRIVPECVEFLRSVVCAFVPSSGVLGTYEYQHAQALRLFYFDTAVTFYSTD